VRKSFGKTEIIRGASLDRGARASACAIIGPNGAGKSTLFNLISGRFAVTSGAHRAERRTITVGLKPYEINRLRPVAQLPGQQPLHAPVGVREHALRRALEPGLPLLVLAVPRPTCSDANERAERGAGDDQPGQAPRRAGDEPAPMPSSARSRSASPSPAAPA
jgi:ABC-type thiamine transport system ATPase subunit